MIAITAIIFLILASLLASGILFQHRRWITWLAASGVLLEGFWLILTLLARLFQVTSNELVFIVGGFLLLIIFLLFIQKSSWPAYEGRDSLVRETTVMMVTGIVLAAAWLITTKNGFAPDGSWITHGFYNGDTMTMVSLTQRSLFTSGLLNSNPFSGGGDLEYPTLWHAGLATGIKLFNLGFGWFRYLPWLTYGQIILTVPLFFLIWDTVFPPPNNKYELWLGVRSRIRVYVLQALLVLYVATISWDGFIFPQTHFFVTGLFLLLIALLCQDKSSSVLSFVNLLLGVILAVILLLTNAVIGMSAIAAAIIYLVTIGLAGNNSTLFRLTTVLLIGLLVIAYFLFIPGEAAFGPPDFSYTASESLLRLAPIIIILAFVIIRQPEEKYIAAAAAALISMAFIVLFFSNREIIQANAERFVYSALLVSFSLLLPPIIYSYYAFVRASSYRSLMIMQRLALLSSAAVLAITLALPSLISVANAHDKLMRIDRQVVTVPMQNALAWINNHTAEEAIFLASPYSPWSIPMFTGRALLRADYWLSPDDETLAALKSAWNGERKSQELVLKSADYLLITNNEANWPLTYYERVYSSDGISIYRL